ncbi:MAG: disulfide bond formation protein B [Alphaproteobacteria bacterium]|nr:disulfide bond formation protein B [Alphaproteobacteria bacterium]
MPACLARLSATRLGLVAALAATAALAGALGSQYWGGLQPCPLCYGQRYPYWIVIALGLAVPLLPTGAARRAALALVAGLFLGNASLALYHVGVEAKWWESFVAGCAAPAATARTVEDLLAQLTAAPIIRCDEVAFRFLGLSMAGWNAVYAGAFGALVLVWLMLTRRTER